MQLVLGNWKWDNRQSVIGQNGVPGLSRECRVSVLGLSVDCFISMKLIDSARRRFSR